jgi:hypothetical protein
VERFEKVEERRLVAQMTTGKGFGDGSKREKEETWGNSYSRLTFKSVEGPINTYDHG